LRRGTVVGLLCLALAAPTLAQSSSREEVLHRGDIVLGGRETMTIDNATYELVGEIHLGGSSTLVIRSSELRFRKASPSIWGRFAKIELRDRATLRIEGSVVTVISPDRESEAMMIDVIAYDSSQIAWDDTAADGAVIRLFDDSQLAMRRGTVFEMNLKNSAGAVLDGSHVSWALGFEFVESARASLTGLVPGQIADLSFPGTSAASGSVPSLQITNSSVGAWSVLAGDAADITLLDCQVDRLQVMLQSPRGRIGGLGPGYYSDWTPTRDGGLIAPLRLHLINTTVTGSVCVWLVGGSNPIEIADSRITNLLLYQYAGTATLADCMIDGFWINESKADLRFLNSKVRLGFDLMRSSISISGSVAVSQEALFGTWESSTVLRTFEVCVIDHAGSPIPNVRVQVEAPSGQVYKTVTNAEGLASFSLSFADGTSQLVWKVTAASPDGKNLTAALGFLSASPMVLRLP